MSTNPETNYNTNSGTNPDPDEARSAMSNFEGQGDTQTSILTTNKRMNPTGQSGYTPEGKRINFADSDDEMDDAHSQISTKSGEHYVTSMDVTEPNDETVDDEVTEEPVDTQASENSPATYADVSKPPSSGQTQAKYHFGIVKVDENGLRSAIAMCEYNEVFNLFGAKQLEAVRSGFVPHITKTNFFKGKMYSQTDCDKAAQWIVQTARTIKVGDKYLKAFPKADLEKELIMTTIININARCLVMDNNKKDVLGESIKEFNHDAKGSCTVLATKELDMSSPQNQSGSGGFKALWVRMGVDDEFKNYVESKNFKLKFLMNDIVIKIPAKAAQLQAEAKAVKQQKQQQHKQLQEKLKKQQEADPRTLESLLFSKAQYKQLPDKALQSYHEKLQNWGINRNLWKTVEEAVEFGVDLKTVIRKPKKSSKASNRMTLQKLDVVTNDLRVKLKPATLGAPGTPPKTPSKPAKGSPKPTVSGKSPKAGEDKDKVRIPSGEEYRKQQLLEKQKKNQEKKRSGSKSHSDKSRSDRSRSDRSKSDEKRRSRHY